MVATARCQPSPRAVRAGRRHDLAPKKPAKPRLQPATLDSAVGGSERWRRGRAMAVRSAGVAGTRTQWMLFHSPVGASGTFDRS